MGAPPIMITPAAAFEDLKTATHEAGHAVIRHALGGTIFAVGIVNDATASGVCVREGSLDLLDNVVYLLAGGIAERKFSGGRRRDGDAEDYESARRLVAGRWKTTPDDPRVEAMLARISILAAARVTEHWPWIQRVAAEMVRRRVLNGDDIERLRIGVDPL